MVHVSSWSLSQLSLVRGDVRQAWPQHVWIGSLWFICLSISGANGTHRGVNIKSISRIKQTWVCLLMLSIHICVRFSSKQTFAFVFMNVAFQHCLNGPFPILVILCDPFLQLGVTDV